MPGILSGPLEAHPGHGGGFASSWALVSEKWDQGKQLKKYLNFTYLTGISFQLGVPLPSNCPILVPLRLRLQRLWQARTGQARLGAWHSLRTEWPAVLPGLVPGILSTAIVPEKIYNWAPRQVAEKLRY